MRSGRLLAGMVGLLLGLVCTAPASGAVDSEFFGLSGFGPPNVEEEWGQLGDARIGTWRGHLRWAGVEPNAPTDDPPLVCGDKVEDAAGKWHCYHWGEFDALVEAAADAGMRVQPYADDSPSWVTPECPSVKCPPLKDEPIADAPIAHWKLFLKRFVDRYGPEGSFWDAYLGTHRPIEWVQPWNEPNFNTNWCHPDGGDAGTKLDCFVKAKQYAKLVTATCDAVKGSDCSLLEPNDPESAPKVLLAGLPETFQSNDTRMIKFLANVYKNTSKRNFQGVALHPFAKGKEGVRGAVLRAKDKMKKFNGWKFRGVKVPIMITEFAWVTSGPSDDTCADDPGPDPPCRLAPNVPFKTDKDGQRSKLKKTFRMLANHTSDYHLKRAIWFGHDDDYDNPLGEGIRCCSTGSWARYSGLFYRRQYQEDPLYPKPAWCGYIEITDELLHVPGPPSLPDCTPP